MNPVKILVSSTSNNYRDFITKLFSDRMKMRFEALVSLNIKIMVSKS